MPVMATEATTNNTKLQAYFERVYGKKLSNAEVLEYKDRLVKFFSLLIEIDRRENVTKTYDKPIK